MRSPQSSFRHSLHSTGLSRRFQYVPGRFPVVLLRKAEAFCVLGFRDGGLVPACLEHRQGLGIVIEQVQSAADASTRQQVAAFVLLKAAWTTTDHQPGGFLREVEFLADTTNLLRHCKEHPDDAAFCSFGGVRARQATAPISATTAIPNMPERRIKAAVAMAPIGAIFDEHSFERVNVAVRIYCADRDTLLPCRYHAEKIYKSLSRAAEYVVLQNAGHYSFIAPFPESIKGQVGEAAQDPDGFDRAARHAKLNPEILDFFDRKLK